MIDSGNRIVIKNVLFTCPPQQINNTCRLVPLHRCFGYYRGPSRYVLILIPDISESDLVAIKLATHGMSVIDTDVEFIQCATTRLTISVPSQLKSDLYDKNVVLYRI